MRPEDGDIARMYIIKQTAAMYDVGQPASGVPAFGTHLGTRAMERKTTYSCDTDLLG